MLKGEFPSLSTMVTYNHQWCWAVCQACISLLRLPEPRAKRKTSLKVKCFKEAFNWFKMNLAKTRERSAGAKTREGVQSGPNLIPPSFMYDTTVVLSVATSTIMFEQRS